MSNHAASSVIGTTDWVADHSDDSNVSVVEVNVDIDLYAQGHVPGAVGWSWRTQLCDTVRRDILSKSDIEALLSSSGISPDSTIVLYGDSNNWFAAWAFWQLKVYGHSDVRMMDGGRKKWEAEGRSMTTDAPSITPSSYTAKEADNSLRAFLSEVREQVAAGAVELVDVRSPAEFSGEILAPPGRPETCQRGGHMPGAAYRAGGGAVRDEPRPPVRRRTGRPGRSSRRSRPSALK